LIINTHNQPEYLARVLMAVARQIALPNEVLLGVDGSETEASRAGLPANDDLLEKAKREQSVRCNLGLDQHQPASK